MNRFILKLMRPNQWAKNLFVLAPLFFGGRATDWHCVWSCLLASLAFCLAASGVYCFNDIHDVEADRRHPIKRMRPIASGSVSKQMAYAVMFTSWILAFALVCINFGSGMRRGIVLTLLAYILMNISYCLKIKQVAIIDVFVIATGFVLRIVAGGLATGIALSHWIVLITFMLALFLALAKRRDDLGIYEKSGVQTRANIKRYNMDFLNHSMGVLCSVIIICYIIYTVSEDVVRRADNRYLYVTSVFVLAGILRYMQLTFVDQKSGSPTKVLLHDHFLQACVAGWVAAFAFIIYANR